MPGTLLHLGATVHCSHGAHAMPAAHNPRVRVSGQPIVTQTSCYNITGCPFNIASVPSPCVTAQWVSVAKRILSNGIPVLLLDSQAVCTPNGTPLKITVAQPRVTGM